MQEEGYFILNIVYNKHVCRLVLKSGYYCNECSTYLVQSGHYIPVEIKINAYQKGNRIIISKYLFFSAN